MSFKTAIVDALGEQALLLPNRIEGALLANDRLKVCFTLLQAAQAHADHPAEAFPDLSAEERAAGIDAELDAALRSSQREPDGRLHLPGAARLRQMMVDDLTRMQLPLALAGRVEADATARRVRALTEELAPLESERVAPGLIAAITRASALPAGLDSPHRLVMDLHKAVNALQGSLAQESLDGARVWRIEEADRPLIRAFMAGVNETAPLKFDHPGLGTTATRSGERLVIQNDIGTTDAHILVVHVEGLTAVLTCTDVHVQRLAFFQSLFKPFAVRWSDARSSPGQQLGEAGGFSLTTGRFAAENRDVLERYLAFLGSRIVFLIDWNRARKQLRQFLPKAEALRLLKWAADNRIGHRGFLQLGGERLLFEAIEFAQPAPLRYGEPLHESLGTEAALEYLQFVFREAADGLLHGRSERFIRDAIKAELARRFRTADASLIGLALDHSEKVFDLAETVREALLRSGEPGSRSLLERCARRARRWEQESDVIVSRVRSLARRTTRPNVYATLLHEADEAADALEEAMFLAKHLPAVAPSSALLEPVQALAGLLVAGAQESVKMFETARHVTRAGEREDLQDFFAAVDRIVAIEHETDVAERLVTSALLNSSGDVRTFHLLWSLTRALEQAADALSRSALMLRDHLLNDVMAG